MLFILAVALIFAAKFDNCQKNRKKEKDYSISDKTIAKGITRVRNISKDIIKIKSMTKNLIKIKAMTKSVIAIKNISNKEIRRENSIYANNKAVKEYRVERWVFLNMSWDLRSNSKIDKL